MPRTGHLAELTRLAPGRPALLLGARIALATALPLLLVPWIGAIAATWASTGAYSIAIADKGGSYRTRALAMSVATAGAALAVLVGGLASHHAVAAVILMLVWSGLCAFAGALGPQAASVGTTTAVLFAIALAWPPASSKVLLTRVLAMFASGLWAMVLALFFWPVRVYKPARFAVARAVRALAVQARATEPLPRQAEVRDAIETARQVLVATRRGRRGESGRGERLLALLQLVEVMFAAEVQLAEVLETLVAAGLPQARREELERALGTRADALDELAARIEVEGKLNAPRSTPAVTPPALDSLDDAQRLHWQQALLLLGRMQSELTIANELAATLYDDAPLASEPPPPPLEDVRPSLLETIRENLTGDSVFFRHATRVAATATAAVAVTRLLQLERGYWVTITVLVLLQPYTPATVTKTLQRVTGTVLGALIAALVVSLVRDHLALVGIATALAAVSAAVLQLNYALYSFFVTPTFVLLAEAGARDPRLPELRVVNTLIGGVLAFIGARLLWPHAERRRFPDELASALDALRDYFETVAQAVGERAPMPWLPLRQARRRFGLAINRADASFQRLLAESRAQTHALEPAMTALVFIRRTGATIGAAGSSRQLLPAAGEPTPFAQRIAAALDDLAAAVRDQRPPAALPALDQLSAGHPPLLAARLDRLAEQLIVLHQAIVRWLRG